LCRSSASTVFAADFAHNLAKVGVEGSNPFARSKFPLRKSERYDRAAVRRPFAFGAYILAIKKL
jgi:hypothetical protein